MLTLTNVVSGSKLSIGDAAITAIMGYAVVFLGLVLLMVVVIVMGKIMASKNEKAKAAAATAPAATAPAPEAPKAEPAPGSCGEIKLYDTSDRDAAMIMAIVADKMGKPLNELRFKSIKQVKEDK
jgi:Na+-transporting methylmalonyl-CoA/oxaloacetate decarboxylase gamma subunit